jgi:GABA(A) receptor-associated protein
MYKSLLNTQFSKFKSEYTFQQRRSESDRVTHKYPDRIPIICEKGKSTELEEIDKNKYLVPCDLTCGQFIYVIRKRLHLPAEKAIFIMINGIIPSQPEHLMTIYNKYKHDDGFLYINYMSENVFGFRNIFGIEWNRFSNSWRL